MIGLFKAKNKGFIKELMKKAIKEKEGSLATRILLQFIPKTELKEPPKKKKLHKFYGDKPSRQAYDGKIGITNGHGIVGKAIFEMKRERVLASKMKG